MFRIGLFSVMNRVTMKTLRYYDEIGLLKPSCVDEFTGYRMYTSDQLPRLQNIIALKQLGLSLTDIGIILQNDGNSEDVKRRLEQKKNELLKHVEESHDQLRKLSHYIDAFQKDSIMENTVVIKDLPEVIVASLRKVVKNYDELFTLAPAMGEVMKKHKVTCAVPEYCFNIYHDGEYKESDIDVEICEAVVTEGQSSDGVTYKHIPAVQTAACIFHKGPYRTLGSTYGFVMKWIEDNGYEVNGHPRESYIDGIWNKQSEEDWLTEIQVPVSKK